MDDAPRPVAAAPGTPAAQPWSPSAISEAALREVLHSPLEGDPRRPRGGSRPGRVSFLILAVAAAAGAGLTVLVSSQADGAAPTTTTAATVTTLPGPALPAGYRPVGEGYGARVERILQRSDGVFITISLAVDADHDPAKTASHQGGDWLLEFPDGTTVPSSSVVFDPVARAAATIVFPAVDRNPAEATLRLVAAAELHQASLTATVTGSVPALPVTGSLSLEPDPAAFDLQGAATLRLTALTLSAGRGSVEWTIEGGEVTAHVEPVLTLTGGATVHLARQDPFFGFRNRMLSIPPPPLAAAGRVELVPVYATSADPGIDFTVTAALEVTWATLAPAEAALPLEAVLLVDVRATG